VDDCIPLPSERRLNDYTSLARRGVALKSAPGDDRQEEGVRADRDRREREPSMFWLLVIAAGLLGQPLLLVAALLIQLGASLRRASRAPASQAELHRPGK